MLTYCFTVAINISGKPDVRPSLPVAHAPASSRRHVRDIGCRPLTTSALPRVIVSSAIRRILLRFPNDPGDFLTRQVHLAGRLIRKRTTEPLACFVLNTRPWKTANSYLASPHVSLALRLFFCPQTIEREETESVAVFTRRPRTRR